MTKHYYWGGHWPHMTPLTLGESPEQKEMAEGVHERGQSILRERGPQDAKEECGDDD